MYNIYRYYFFVFTCAYNFSAFFTDPDFVPIRIWTQEERKNNLDPEIRTRIRNTALNTLNVRPHVCMMYPMTREGARDMPSLQCTRIEKHYVIVHPQQKRLISLDVPSTFPFWRRHLSMKVFTSLKKKLNFNIIKNSVQSLPKLPDHPV